MMETGLKSDRNRWLWEPLIVFAVTRLGMFFLAAAGQSVLPYNHGSQHGPFPAISFLDGWFRWDAGWYLSIVEHGYWYNPQSHQGSIAFFPLYPILISLLAYLVGSTSAAALVVTNVSFAAALVALYRLVLKRFDRSMARRTLILLVTFPFALFYSAVYTEALFLFLVVTTFLLAEHDRWWLAGVVGALAALTRNVGVGLAPALFLMYLQRQGFDWRKVRWQIFASGIVVVGTGLFMLYSYERFGDPLAFSTASVFGWNHYTVAKGDLSRLNPTTFGPGNYFLVLALDVLTAVVCLVGAIPTARLLGLGYGFFVLFAIVVPLGVEFESLGRFVSVLFPVFVVLAYYLRRPLLTNVVLAGSSGLLGIFTILFVNAYWIV